VGCGAASQAAQRPRAGSAGVTAELLPGWRSTPGDDGNVTDPLARVVVASSRIAPAASACQTSSYAFADDAAALVLVEWQGPARGDATAAPRPERFVAADLNVRRGVHECYAGRSGTVFFEERGRLFGAYVFLGDGAPETLVDELCTVLSSLVIEPPAG
jgi:hypothetical protein